MHYAPPGAQVLYTNPLFVRSHDFIGVQGANQTWRATEVFGTGWPSNAGGRLVGSLAGLPYALAEAEQNFLIPVADAGADLGRSGAADDSERQDPALVERDARADALGGPAHALRRDRCWRKPRSIRQLREHGAGRRSARTRRPRASAQVSELLAAGRRQAARSKTSRRRKCSCSRTDMVAATRTARRTCRRRRSAALAAESPDEVSYEAISHAFGTPKPTLANSYQPELLNLRTFPTLMGYSSRILAESWESNPLYYAALADELHLPPSQLNVLIPEWTQKAVERIFATHLEDWPALLRSLRLVGDDVRAKGQARSWRAEGGTAVIDSEENL